ncbi:outer membrane lipoprotein chaperone LolA [Paraglaciecola arctica]|uniref:outer membrane lipoprotein chaperone LolA n=1 Tax=Paraglaciecola arctica TaxID=1128911 RepID=UPI001C07D7E2|nr:outer membrane lipoprotein chaperone LolA [Paraglaciecola arctica]MBU3005192.1 outer membrane lipoprotein chaperone LolA [Paraglaciecola arctica]
MNKLTQFSTLFLFLAVVFISNLAIANDTTAKQQLKLKLASLVTYQANFEQRVVDIENTLLQQATGRIVLQQPSNLYWELFEPNESVLLADGENIWNVDPFLEQVVVYGANAALDDNPLILLTNPDSSKWLDFEVTQSEGQFVITPRQPNGGIESLRLVFDGDLLVELESKDGQQQKSLLTFSEIKQNKTLPPETFVFVMPQGYELDDQR